MASYKEQIGDVAVFWIHQEGNPEYSIHTFKGNKWDESKRIGKKQVVRGREAFNKVLDKIRRQECQMQEKEIEFLDGIEKYAPYGKYDNGYLELIPKLFDVWTDGQLNENQQNKILSELKYTGYVCEYSYTLGLFLAKFSKKRVQDNLEDMLTTVQEHIYNHNRWGFDDWMPVVWKYTDCKEIFSVQDFLTVGPDHKIIKKGQRFNKLPNSSKLEYIINYEYNEYWVKSADYEKLMAKENFKYKFKNGKIIEKY